MEQDPDRRRQRTRKAISDAFVRLLFTRRYGAIRTIDVIEAANVGRSTFYEHFRNKDDVLIAVIEPVFGPLADAGAGRGNVLRTRMTLEHMWEQRALGRILFEPPLLARLQRKLAAMIEARAGPAAPPDAPTSLLATGAAAGQLAMLRMWLAGEVPCRSDDLAAALAGRPGGAADIPSGARRPIELSRP